MYYTLGIHIPKAKVFFYLNVKKKPVLVADEVESGPNRGQVCRGVHAPLQQYVQQYQFRALERPGLIRYSGDPNSGLVH